MLYIFMTPNQRNALTCSFILTPLLSSYSSRTSCEANLFSASQEIPRILWNPKVHYRIYKCPPPVLILSQVILSTHLCLGLPSGLFPSGLTTKTLYAPLLSPYVLHLPPISQNCSLYMHPNITLNFGPQGPSAVEAV
jgi:hypothetical protein